MRTTLNIDDDVLLAAKDRAARYKISVGQALSGLAREALTRMDASATRNGLPLFPHKDPSTIVTPELIRELLDDE